MSPDTKEFSDCLEQAGIPQPFVMTDERSATVYGHVSLTKDADGVIAAVDVAGEPVSLKMLYCTLSASGMIRHTFRRWFDALPKDIADVALARADAFNAGEGSASIILGDLFGMTDAALDPEGTLEEIRLVEAWEHAVAITNGCEVGEIYNLRAIFNDYRVEAYAGLVSFLDHPQDQAHYAEAGFPLMEDPNERIQRRNELKATIEEGALLLSERLGVDGAQDATKWRESFIDAVAEMLDDIEDYEEWESATEDARMVIQWSADAGIDVINGLFPEVDTPNILDSDDGEISEFQDHGEYLRYGLHQIVRLIDAEAEHLIPDLVPHAIALDIHDSEQFEDLGERMLSMEERDFHSTLVYLSALDGNLTTSSANPTGFADLLINAMREAGPWNPAGSGMEVPNGENAIVISGISGPAALAAADIFHGVIDRKDEPDGQGEPSDGVGVEVGDVLLRARHPAILEMHANGELASYLLIERDNSLNTCLVTAAEDGDIIGINPRNSWSIPDEEIPQLLKRAQATAGITTATIH